MNFLKIKLNSEKNKNNNTKNMYNLYTSKK